MDGRKKGETHPEEPVRAKRRSAEDNLEVLLAGASALMADRGYEETSIRDVARETGFSLAGMYYYFKGKEDLLYKIQARTFGSLLDEQEALGAQGGTADERLRRLVTNHLAFMMCHTNELKVCTFELESLQGENYKSVEKLRKRYYRLLAGIVAELMGISEVDSGKKEVRHHALFVFGMLNWTLMWFNPRVDQPIAELAESLVGFVLRGLPRDQAEVTG